jgi:hypothetical protein
MTPLTFSIAAFACLGLSLLLVGLLLRKPGWQLRDSPLHGLACLGLGVVAALVLGLWETASSPGLRTGTPMLVLLASLPLAAISLRQGMTPRGVRSGRLQRVIVAVPAIAAVVLWARRLEAFVPSGRTLLEQDLLANAASIAGYGVGAIVLIACVPVFAAFRQKALRREALPLAALAVLALPTLVLFSGATVEATCAGQFDREQAWCRPEASCLAGPEVYRFGGGAWIPQGGELASYAWQRGHSLAVPESLEAQLLAYRAKGREHGLFLSGAMAVDGSLSPRDVTGGLMWVQGSLERCFEDAQKRDALGPLRGPLSFRVDHSGQLVEVLPLAYGDAELQACVDASLERTRFTDSCSATAVDLELVWLGPEPETSASL